MFEAIKDKPDLSISQIKSVVDTKIIQTYSISSCVLLDAPSCARLQYLRTHHGSQISYSLVSPWMAWLVQGGGRFVLMLIVYYMIDPVLLGVT